MPPLDLVGAVVIARNEGDRLRRCLSSIPDNIHIVYVDSGSTDGSLEWAREQALELVELDTSVAFTAARARNAGFRRLQEIVPHLEFIQFVDGDCELFESWLRAGLTELDSREAAVVVCGRIREHDPDRTIYQQLFDIELDLQAGPTTHCGGIFLVRANAFEAVNGFRPEIVAGEEPELCARLRKKGGEIWRLDTDMAYHDSDISRFGHWWKRMVRGGQAYTEGFLLHHESREGRAVASILFWGLLLPLVTLVSSWWILGWSLIFLALYPLQFLRIWRREVVAGRSGRIARAQAFFMLVAKFAQIVGMCRLLLFRVLRRHPTSIEYKTAS